MNISDEKLSSANLVRSGRKIFPAEENILSTGPDDAGMARYRRACCDRRGYFLDFSFQYDKGQLVDERIF